MMEEELDIEHAKSLVANEHWKWAKDKLTTMMDVYRNANLTGSDTAIGKEYRRRRDVASLVTSLFDYVEGTADIPTEFKDETSTIQRF